MTSTSTSNMATTEYTIAQLIEASHHTCPVCKKSLIKTTDNFNIRRTQLNLTKCKSCFAEYSKNRPKNEKRVSPLSEDVLAYHREYYKKHNVKVDCECGVNLSKHNIKKHLASIRHMKYSKGNVQ